MIKRGNQKSFNKNIDVAIKNLNKENRYSHLLRLHDWVVHLGQNLRHNDQGMVVFSGKNPRQIWDSSTIRAPMDIVMNDITTTEDEAEIIFGMGWILFKCYLYNLRSSFPDAVIYLALTDIKAWFFFPDIHPDLTGAFVFLVNNIYCLAIAMVFGSNVSASS